MLQYIIFFGLIALAIVVTFLAKPNPSAFGNQVDWSQRRKCDSGSERKLFDALAERNFRMQTQVKVGERFRIDIFLPDYSLAVEVDSIYHDTPEAQAKDRRKDAAIRERGWEVIRVRAEDITKNINGVVAKVIAATAWNDDKQPAESIEETTQIISAGHAILQE